MISKLNDRKIIKRIVNSNFTFTDLDPKKFPDTVNIKSNIFCPFHEHNYTEGNAKIYYNEDHNIFVLHCFVEARNYTAYDYLNLIMCKSKQLYSSPKAYLLSHMSNNDFIEQYKMIEKGMKIEMESQYKKRCEYIDNTYNSTGNIIDYIEALYTA